MFKQFFMLLFMTIFLFGWLEKLASGMVGVCFCFQISMVKVADSDL